MASKVKYERLEANEFRLVNLLPAASASAQIRLEHIYTSLDAPYLPYEALSYTWEYRLDGDDDGIGELEEVIVINGQGILLHKNLADALRCIRTNRSQRLWADALCIDQSNAVERGSQVLLMRDIFTNATKVWAWLGREGQNSHLAMDFLKFLTSHDEESIEEWFSKEAFHPPYYPTWEALRCLMGRTWWRRAWIVQEFALPKEVIFLCGDRRLSVEDLEAADRIVFTHLSAAKHGLVTTLRQSVPINARTFDPARNLLDLRHRLQRHERISALASLQMTRLAQATDPRDYLFAKLGLSGRELAKLCPPNYLSQAEDVWFAFFSTYLKQEKDLYIMCLAGMEPRVFCNLPSWLPDWGPSKPSYTLCSFITGEKPPWPCFDAANGTDPIVTFTSNIHADTVLKCQGLQIDVVDGVARDPWAAEPRPICQSQCRKNVYKTRSGAFQALCRTVTANTNRMGTWGPPHPGFSNLYARRWRELNRVTEGYELDPSQALPHPLYSRASGFERSWRSMRYLKFGGEALRYTVEGGLETESTSTSTSKLPNEKNIEPPTAPNDPLWTALEHSTGQVCFERCLFTTVKGYLGIGPATVQPGDCVVILLGCKVPVLLRPQLQRFRLIGEAYVDGIMYGEAMVELLDNRSSLPVVTFEIY